jgi:membrane fusion protein, multidrug efflux system
MNFLNRIHGQAAVLLLIVLLSGCKEEVEVQAPESRPAKFFTVKTSEEQNTRRYPAVVEANEKANVSFKVAGKIIKLNVKQGQLVNQGDLIAELDARDYELAVNRAKSQLEATQAEERALKIGVRPEDVRILENNLASAKTQFERDERFFKQRQGLVEKGAITREELEASEATYLVSKANFETARKELEKGKTGARKEDIEAVEARVRDLKENVRNAENALKDTKLYAPYSARVIDKQVDQYEEVNAKQTIVNLQQIETIKLNFSLPENVVFNLERGNVGSFSVVFSGMPEREIPVNLHEFRLEADAKTRTFSCWVTMPTLQDAIVLPGMTAEILHRNPRAENPGLPVPSTALFADESKAYFVWKVNQTDMTVHKTPVSVGPMSGDEAWVTDGLKPGEVIVGAGANYLTEGMKVQSLSTKA